MLTPDGGKPIEQFRRGDRILARSEDNPEAPVEVKMVEETFVRVSPIVNLRVRGQEIRTTTEHPIYVRGKGWICARELKAGDELSSHDGQWVAVEAVTDLNEVATVYNLRVSDYHTYFVGSREWGFSVWAHNANYVVVPYRDGFRLYQVGENGAFTVVNSAGTTTPRYFATRQLAQEAVESGGGALISNNLNRFSRASEFGIQPAGRLRSQTAHTGLETHHLIEQRFAETLGVSESQMAAIALTPAEHDAFTVAWRQAIGHVTDRTAINTANATRQQIMDAARRIYRDYPEILLALGL